MADVPTFVHPAATLAEVHTAFRWKPANAAARTAINIGASFADDVGCMAWQQDDNSVWLAKATGTGSSKWQQVGSALDIVSLSTDTTPTAGYYIPVYTGVTNKKATVGSLLNAVLPAGGYVGEVLIWNGTAWVVAAAGDFSFTLATPRGTDTHGLIGLNSGSGFIGMESSPDSTDPYAILQAPLDGNASVNADATTAGTQTAQLGAIFDGVPHPTIQAGAISIGEAGWESDPHFEAISFFGAPLAAQKNIGGGVGQTTLDTIRAALAAYGLGVDNGAIGNWTYQGTGQTTNGTPVVLQVIALPDNSITTVEYTLVARDTGNNWYKSIYRNEFTRSAGGSATILDSTTPSPQYVANAISGFTNAPLAVSGNTVEARIVASGSVHCRYYYRIRVETVLLASAT